MSNYGLQMEVSSLRSVLNAIRAENARIERELNASIACLVHSTSCLVASENLIGRTIENSKNVLNNSNELALKTHETQIFIEKLYKRYKNVELANKHIRELNDKRNYEFKTFRRIRKLFEGMLESFNLNFVSLDKINKLIEKNHLLTDKYWLTPCLMGFVGWIQNDKELADKSIKEAIKYDKKSTSLFYMLANLKCNRIDSAVKWLKLYNTCNFVGNDEKDILMLLSIYGDIDKFSKYKELKNEIEVLIKRIGNENVEYINSNIAEILTRCYSKYNKLFIKNECNFKNLKEHVSEYSDIEKSLYYASNNYKILEILRGFIEKSKSDHLNKYDNNLIELINIPSDAEKDTYNQIMFNELIIKLKGDKEKAEEITQKSQEEKNENFNFIKSINKYLFNTKEENVNNKLKGNMFLFSNIFHKIACNNHVRIYSSFLRDKYNISVGEYKTETDFQDITKEYNKIDNYYDNIKNDLISCVKNTGAYIAFATNIAVIAASICLKDVKVLMFIPALILIGIYLLFKNKQKINDIENATAKNKAESHIVIKNIFDEYDAYKNMYNKYDSVKEDIALLFDGIDSENIFNLPKSNDDNENAYLVDMYSLADEKYEDVDDAIDKNKNLYDGEENIVFGNAFNEIKDEQSNKNNVAQSRVIQHSSAQNNTVVRQINDKQQNEKIINAQQNEERQSILTTLEKNKVVIPVVCGVVLMVCFVSLLINRNVPVEKSHQKIESKDKEETNSKKIVGWYNKNGKRYYYDSRGDLYKNKWLNYENKWYYFDKNGEMVINRLLTIDKAIYYFNSDGLMVTNEWVIYNLNYYYFNETGSAVKNKWVGDYYLGSDGKMLTNTITPDGYKVDANGKYISETVKSTINQARINQEQVNSSLNQIENSNIVEKTNTSITNVTDATTEKQDSLVTTEFNYKLNSSTAPKKEEKDFFEPTAEIPVYDPNTPTSASEAGDTIVPPSSNEEAVKKNYKIGTTNIMNEKVYLEDDKTCSVALVLPLLIDQNGENATDLNGNLIGIQNEIMNEIIEIAESEEAEGKRILSIRLESCKLHMQDEQEVAVRITGMKNYRSGSSKGISVDIYYSKDGSSIYYDIDSK